MSERFQKDYRKTTAQHHQTSVNRNETGTSIQYDVTLAV